MGVLYEGWMILAALIPSIGLLFLFWVILKHLLEGDRREREAIRRWEAEHDAAQNAGPTAQKDGKSVSTEIPDRQNNGPEGTRDPA